MQIVVSVTEDEVSLELSDVTEAMWDELSKGELTVHLVRNGTIPTLVGILVREINVGGKEI